MKHRPSFLTGWTLEALHEAESILSLRSQQIDFWYFKKPMSITTSG